MSEQSTNEVTQKEFAALRRVSEAMVSRWKAKGRLVMSDDGQRVRVAETNDLLDRTLDPARGGDRTGGASKIAAFPPPAAGSRERAARGERDSTAYHDAARDEKQERAAILRLERMELEGKLVSKDRVEREAQARAAQARDALLSLSDRLAPLLAAETDVDKIRAMLDAEVRHVAAQLAADARPLALEDAA